MKQKIHLLLLTYNRLHYTKKCLPRLFQDKSEDFQLTIWDNGSTDGTQKFLKKIKDPRILEKVFSKKNMGQNYVTNKVWSESSADLVGKVDNDCLVTPGWTRIISKAHQDIPKLGAVGCWHFPPKDFDYKRAKHKIQKFGKHKIFRHPWVDGSALLVKKKDFLKFGPCKEEEYLTKFWLRMALKGYINGFYYPLIYQDHMDDPDSKYTLLKDEKSFSEAKKITYGLKHHKLKSLDDNIKFKQKILHDLLDGPWKAKHYVGWRRKVTRIKEILSNCLK